MIFLIAALFVTPFVILAYLSEKCAEAQREAAYEHYRLYSKFPWLLAFVICGAASAQDYAFIGYVPTQYKKIVRELIPDGKELKHVRWYESGMTQFYWTRSAFWGQPQPGTEAFSIPYSDEGEYRQGLNLYAWIDRNGHTAITLTHLPHKWTKDDMRKVLKAEIALIQEK